jgi:L-desosaminyltransferase/glycosyltransferase DesVII/glycosyltransferase OleGII/desosaminyltransferase OleGI
VRDAVTELLGDPGYRAGANRIREEISAMPSPEDAVPALDRLAATAPTPLGS